MPPRHDKLVWSARCDDGRGGVVRAAPGGSGALHCLRPPLPDPRPAGAASARCASTTAAGCASPGATSPPCSAIPSRRSPSSTSCPAPRRSPSGCSAATSTAPTARTGSPSRRCATRPADVAGRMSARHAAARSSRCARADGRRRRRFILQRAAHHRRMGRGRLQEAAAAGLKCAFVSNGNATPEVLDYLRP